MSTHYWDTNPCNIRHSISPVGTLKWSEEITERKYRVERHIHGFAQFPHWKDKSVLEIGCGLGTDTIEFAKAGASIVAVDSSLNSLYLASQRPNMPSNTLRNLDAQRELPDGKFDLVYAFGSLHHMQYPLRALFLAHAHCSKELRIMLYAKYSWKFLTRQQPEAAPGCPIVHTYSKQEAKRLVELAGFKVISIKKRHIFPYKLPEYKAHMYKKYWWSYLLPERLLGHHLLIVAKP